MCPKCKAPDTELTLFANSEQFWSVAIDEDGIAYARKCYHDGITELKITCDICEHEFIPDQCEWSF